MILAMRFPDDAPVTQAKQDALRARITALGIELATVQETSIRAGGPGGQKVNKTSSGIRLGYRLGAELVQVKWTRERSHALNRFLALRELVDAVEMRVSPGTSERLKERERIRRRKGRSRRRGGRAPEGEAGPAAGPLRPGGGGAPGRE